MFSRDSNPHRITRAAFIISAVGVIASVPVSAIITQPDLPAYVLVVTGIVASLLATRSRSSLSLKALVVLVALMVICLSVHLALHRFNMNHDWLEPVYFAVVAIYCLLVLCFGLLFKNPARDS